MKCMRCDQDVPVFSGMLCEDCLRKKSRLTTKEKEAINLWDHLTDFLSVFALMKAGAWSWACNSECKYVELRIDMRDGGCIIKNKEGKRISPERLAWQYSDETPNPPED
jgi:hypothetical protein